MRQHKIINTIECEVVEFALSICDTEKPIFPPRFIPTVLTNPAALIVVITDDFDTMQAISIAGDVTVDSTTVRKEITKNTENAHHRAGICQIHLTVSILIQCDILSDPVCHAIMLCARD